MKSGGKKTKRTKKVGRSTGKKKPAVKKKMPLAKKKAGKKAAVKKKPAAKKAKGASKKAAKKVRKAPGKPMAKPRAAKKSSGKAPPGKKARTWKTGLKPSEIRELRNQLLFKRAVIQGNLSRMEDGALKINKQDHSVDNMADYGTDNYEQDFTLGLMESVGGVLKEINEALARIEEGGYGICMGCGCVIPKARIRAIPYARYCVNCQSETEKW